ncbi:MAG: hypothetical protein F4037_07375 [Gemmatimonadales bacterium]|nr:hypothetical protein [Candidatus Palauibacter ramosifaciens]
MRRTYPDYMVSGAVATGDIPSHWQIMDLGRIGSFFKGGGGTKADETEEGHPCVRYGDLYTRHDFHIRESRSRINPDRAAVYTQLQYGDLLLAGSGETLEEIGKSAANLLHEPAFCGGDVVICRPEIEIDATFLGYAADCAPSRHQKSGMGRGVTVMHIYGSELKKLAIAVPPLEEQAQIGAFLDAETARIDKLITMQESLIERLDEYRTALITRVVTKGLPPEAAEVAGLDPAPVLRDSGVAWLGAVPEHWDVCQLRRAFSIANGGTPATSDYGNWDGEIAWLTPDDLGRHEGKSISEGRRSITPQGLQSSGARLSPPGSVVLSTRAPIGHLAVTARPAATNQGCRTLVPTAGVVSGFAYYSLLASREVLQATGKGSTFMELSATDLAQHWLPQPPPNEQQVVSNFLDSRSQRIDALQAKAELSIERLGEYRSAVVSAAVTGKIDVRDEALAGVGGGV